MWHMILWIVIIIISMICADFLTGIYHWSVDNYGDGSTPVVGGQIAAFQGHHQKPWTITQRDFCNNLHKVRHIKDIFLTHSALILD